MWSDSHQKAIEESKRSLTPSSILTSPNFTVGFSLSTDASGIGLGAGRYRKIIQLDQLQKHKSNRVRGTWGSTGSKAF